MKRHKNTNSQIKWFTTKLAPNNGIIPALNWEKSLMQNSCTEHICLNIHAHKHNNHR